MAAPHVAGLIAYLIKAEGNLSTDDMSDKLKELALEGVLSDIREYLWYKMLLNNANAYCF